MHALARVLTCLSIACLCAPAGRVDAEEPADEVVIGDESDASMPPAAAPLAPQGNAEPERFAVSSEAAAPASLPVEASSFEPFEFDGIQPGVATLAHVRQLWGDPHETREQGGANILVYAREPFKQVAVTVQGDRVQRIVVDLGESFAVAEVALQLQLTAYRPVQIYDEAGVCLAQAYPERGVALYWATSGKAPEDDGRKVAEVAFGRVDPVHFLLRAQARLLCEDQASLDDVKLALHLDPRQAPAWGLKARLLWRSGRRNEAFEAVSKALQLDAKSPDDRLLYARLLADQGDRQQAVAETRRAISLKDASAVSRARGLVQLGELIATADEPDYYQPIESYQQAIELAESKLDDPHPAVRQAAGDVMIDAHLGLAYTIGWGRWQMKPLAVGKWLDRASALAAELPDSAPAKVAARLRVCQAALAACAGAQGQIDGSPWAEQAMKLGREQLEQTRDPLYRQRLNWQLGLAFHDALQVCQARQEFDAALKYGGLAAECLEQGAPGRQATPGEVYMLARLYYRLGSLCAVQRGQHRQAVAWYEKALPLVGQFAGAGGRPDQQGEMLVTAAISYWNERQRDKAVSLTSRGIQFMEQAVEQGMLEKSMLSTPYANLAAMHEQLGDRVQAASYAEQASNLGTEPAAQE